MGRRGRQGRAPEKTFLSPALRLGQATAGTKASGIPAGNREIRWVDPSGDKARLDAVVYAKSQDQAGRRLRGQFGLSKDPLSVSFVSGRNGPKPEVQKRASSYGTSVNGFDLRKFCEVDWPSFDVGWPPQGSLDLALAQSVRKIIFGQPGHPDQIAYIQIWIDFITDPPKWLKRCFPGSCRQPSSSRQGRTILLSRAKPQKSTPGCTSQARRRHSASASPSPVRLAQPSPAPASPLLRPARSCQGAFQGPAGGGRECAGAAEPSSGPVNACVHCGAAPVQPQKPKPPVLSGPADEDPLYPPLPPYPPASEPARSHSDPSHPFSPPHTRSGALYNPSSPSFPDSTSPSSLLDSPSPQTPAPLLPLRQAPSPQAELHMGDKPITLLVSCALGEEYQLLPEDVPGELITKTLLKDTGTAGHF
ncbi:gag protein-like protein [Leptotrombidium deliense]|uniref:Gag protein-like protein n=1 Tax=Leptotrombidium deliense TaxID=299467 RepID=A0A443SFU3_9ACAR|nr:gag protein-like protein [Leptotrombidium deliense]